MCYDFCGPLNVCAVRGRTAYVPCGGEEDGDRVRGVPRDSVSSAWAVRESRIQGWDLLRWASGPWENPQPYLLLPRLTRALPPVPLREDRARDRVRGRAKRRHRVQAGTFGVQPTSTHEPRASTVERVPWAQSSGINGRGVDLRDFTRADEAPSYGIDRWSTHDAFDSATPSAPTTNCTPLVDYFS